VEKPPVVPENPAHNDTRDKKRNLDDLIFDFLSESDGKH